MNHSRMIIKWIAVSLTTHKKIENFVAHSLSSLMTEVKYLQIFLPLLQNTCQIFI